MNASELRIGNYLFDAYGKTTFKVIPKDIENIFNQTYVAYNPIPLTEEWLVKFGFEEEYNYRNRLIVSQGIYYDTIRKKNGYSIYKNKFRLCVIRYVHQLQNLYFALTGNELTIE